MLIELVLCVCVASSPFAHLCCFLLPVVFYMSFVSLRHGCYGHRITVCMRSTISLLSSRASQDHFIFICYSTCRLISMKLYFSSFWIKFRFISQLQMNVYLHGQIKTKLKTNSNIYRHVCARARCMTNGAGKGELCPEAKWLTGEHEKCIEATMSKFS